MSKALLGIDLGELLVLLLPLPRILDAEAMSKHLANIFQWHAPDLGKAEDDETPADETDAAVEAKGTGWCHTLHHGQKGGCNDDVCRPTGDGNLLRY
jgi:hypothetical protein